jgi:hypothetical protein
MGPLPILGDPLGSRIDLHFMLLALYSPYGDFRVVYANYKLVYTFAKPRNGQCSSATFVSSRGLSLQCSNLKSLSNHLQAKA